MKIGILTYFGESNPGTVLQSYSMYLNINKLYKGEARVEVINYHSFKRNDRPFLSGATIKSIFKDLKRNMKYRKFNRSCYPLSHPYLYSKNYNAAKFYIEKQNYDVIYIGSDTLLELHRVKNGLTIFWLPPEIKAKKIMVAASSRDTQFQSLSKEQKISIQKCLTHIQYIGVRDQATKRLMENFKLNKDVQLIPDPTFALEVNSSHAIKYAEQHSIGNDDNIMCIHFTRKYTWARRFVNIAKKDGYKIVSLRPCYYADYEFNDLSPLEFAGIFSHFSVVVTHRFHDTVFALKNLVPVISIIPDQSYSNNYGESKQFSLLKEFDLVDTNYVPYPDQINAESLYKKVSEAIESFDKEKIQLQLDRNKNIYLDFLANSKVV